MTKIHINKEKNVLLCIEIAFMQSFIQEYIYVFNNLNCIKI